MIGNYFQWKSHTVAATYFWYVFCPVPPLSLFLSLFLFLSLSLLLSISLPIFFRFTIWVSSSQTTPSDGGWVRNQFSFKNPKNEKKNWNWPKENIDFEWERGDFYRICRQVLKPFFFLKNLKKNITEGHSSWSLHYCLFKLVKIIFTHSNDITKAL